MVSSSETRALLLGYPTYVWNSGHISRGPDRNGLFGVLFPPFGGASPIRSPIDGVVLGMARGVAIGPERWGIVFAEMPDSTVERRVKRLWYGVLQDSVWLSLDRIPLPVGITLHWLRASRLIAEDAGLTFAVPMNSPGDVSEIAMFQMRRERWSYKLLPVAAVSYVSVGYSQAHGLELAVVRADTAGTADSNSLFLHYGPNWLSKKKLANGLLAPVHVPRLSPDGSRMTWWSQMGDRREARAILDLTLADPQVLVIDSSVVQVEPILATNYVGWVADHIDTGSGNRELRFIRAEGDRAKTIAAFPNPFDGGFAVAPQRGDGISLIGPRLEHSDSGTILVSLQLRYAVKCPLN